MYKRVKRKNQRTDTPEIQKSNKMLIKHHNKAKQQVTKPKKWR